MSRSALVALSLFLFTASARAAEIPELIAAGDAALTNFDLSKATTAFKSALKLDNKNYDACWRLTRASVDAATLETDDAKKKLLLIEAQDYARGAVRLNPTGSKGHAFLAVVVGKLSLYQGGRTKVELSKEVKTEAEKAIVLDPQEDIAYHVLGVWNREMVHLNWLMRKFAEVLYGSFPPASMDSALTDLRKAVELAPRAVAHQTELGITLADAGHWTQAKQTLDRAVSMPMTWVTDVYYRKLAATKLKEVNRHLH
jgi:tetratricopeptide (TPR) repeat protein